MKRLSDEKIRMYDRMRARRRRVTNKVLAQNEGASRHSGLRGHWNSITEASSQLNGGYPIAALIMMIALIIALPIVLIFGLVVIDGLLGALLSAFFGFDRGFSPISELMDYLRWT